MRKNLSSKGRNPGFLGGFGRFVFTTFGALVLDVSINSFLKEELQQLVILGFVLMMAFLILFAF